MNFSATSMFLCSEIYIPVTELYLVQYKTKTKNVGYRFEESWIHLL